jgi:ankyrin repeat protein
MPKDDPFYYVKTNDINSLKRLYSENKYIIAQKDNKGRTLLHYSVMENNYDITLFLLEQGINFN